MAQRVEIRFDLRPHQLQLWQKFRRFSVFVCHRRFGKTFLALARMVSEALGTRRPDWRGYYIAPTYKQAKRIAWAYLVRWSQKIPGAKRNIAELSIEFPNGSKIELLGAERYDTLRGLWADRVVLDETALIPSAALTQVILPMLADREGALLAIGTPAGRMNLFWELLEMARQEEREENPEWSHAIYPVSETNIINLEERRRQRKLMSDDEYQQEFECSFNAAILGAYYARELSALEAEGRFGSFGYDRRYPVHCALDLGYSDAMVALFSQTIGNQEQIILARGYSRTSIPEMLDDWAALPFKVPRVILPHDAEAHDLTSGLKRREVFEARGYETVVLSNAPIHEGIHLVRELMPRLYLNAGECGMLREAIAAYRAEFDDVRRVFKTKPLHDWSSHWADALRYLATGRDFVQPWGARPKTRLAGGRR